MFQIFYPLTENVILNISSSHNRVLQSTRPDTNGLDLQRCIEGSLIETSTYVYSVRTIVIVVSTKVWVECHDARHSKNSYASVKGPSRVHDDSMRGEASHDGRSEREKSEYVGRRTRNYTKTMCLLSISRRTRWGFYESLGQAPTRRSVVVYSRKESGPVAQMTLTPSPASPLPSYHRANLHRDLRQFAFCLL